MHVYFAGVASRVSGWLVILLLAAAGHEFANARADELAGATNFGRVLIVKNAAATQAFLPQKAPIREMVNEGLRHFTSQPTVKAAWLSLLSPRDTVGLKVHSTPGRTSGTRPAVVSAFIETLIEAGFSPSQIVVWDHRLIDLRRAGYDELAGRYGVTVAGAMDEGYDPDPKKAYEAPLLGKLVYGDLEFGIKGDGVGRKSYLSKLLTQKITKIVNITPLLNHNYAGVSGALYGLAMGSVDNTLRFEDTQRLLTAVPEIYALPELADRVVLNVMDALICQYRGEERSFLHYSTALNELWFSGDPVALDVLGVQELEREKGEGTQKTPGAQIYANAALMELGTANLEKIHVERLDMSK